MASEEQTIALAGAFQALSLLYSIAHHGMVDMKYYDCSISSVLKLDASSTLDIFGDDLSKLKLGLKELIDTFSNNGDGEKTTEITRYLISIMVLEKKLSQDNEMLNLIKTGIERAESQLKHFVVSDENISQILAQTYQQTISTIPPKIMVSGESKHLNNQQLAARIRALLLASVRAIVLWRQRGGQRWRLLFDRGNYCKIAQKLI